MGAYPGTVTINPADPHVEAFQQIFGRLDEIPVASTFPEAAVFTNESVYRIDGSRLTADQQRRLIEYWAERDGISFISSSDRLEADGAWLAASAVLVVSRVVTL